MVGCIVNNLREEMEATLANAAAIVPVPMENTVAVMIARTLVNSGYANLVQSDGCTLYLKRAA